jgi:predicted nucleotidyltransferase
MLVSYAVHCSTSCWQNVGDAAAGGGGRLTSRWRGYEPQCADQVWYTTDTTRGAQDTRTTMATIVRQPQPIEPIIQQLQNILPQLREEYDVERLGVFGSYVRNEQHAESDIDILVSFRSTPGLLKYISLEQYLSDLSGMRVDLVMESALKPEIGARIRTEVHSIPLNLDEVS